MSESVEMSSSSRPPQKPRGVFRAEWTGPNGEVVLRARDSGGTIIAQKMVPVGADVNTERLLLWSFLNWRDPVVDERSGRFRL